VFIHCIISIKYKCIIFSDLREVFGLIKGDSAADRAADQRANEHGRNGGDPNKYRPEGLPKKYKK
jgi:serum amyloid A protein